MQDLRSNMGDPVSQEFVGSNPTSSIKYTYNNFNLYRYTNKNFVAVQLLCLRQTLGDESVSKFEKGLNGYKISTLKQNEIISCKPYRAHKITGVNQDSWLL